MRYWKRSDGSKYDYITRCENGDGAIVSAGTLVHKDVPGGAFVGGNPMRVIYTKRANGG